MKTTMIQIKKDTADKLKRLKEYGRQSYDEVIRGLIRAGESEALTESEIHGIKRGLDDIRAGRTRSIEEVAKGLGIRLKS